MGTDRQIEQVSKWLVRLQRWAGLFWVVIGIFVLPGTLRVASEYAEAWAMTIDAIIGLLPAKAWYPVLFVISIVGMAVSAYPIGRDVVKACAMVYNETFAEDPLKQAIMRLAASVVFITFPVIVLCVCLVVLMATSWAVHYIGRALLQLVV